MALQEGTGNASNSNIDSKFYLYLSLSLSLGVSVVQAAKPTPESLIQYGPSALELTAADLSQGIVDRQTVGVDLALLRQRLHVGQQLAGNRQKRNEKGLGVLLHDQQLVLEQTRTYSIVPGVETISGTIAGSEFSWFVLSVENERVIGQIHHQGKNYDLSFDETLNSQVLTTIDKSLMPRSDSNPKSMQEYSATPIRQAMVEGQSDPGFMMQSLGDTNANVRVLILYASDVTGISTLSANIIAAFNESLQSAQLEADYMVTLANIIALGDDLEAVCKEEALDMMETDGAPFVNIDTWRSNNHADIVLTIMTTDQYISGCPESGIYGRVGGQASMLLDSSKPFAVSMDTYALGDLTAVHEVGHVLGGGHSDWSHAVLMSNSNNQAAPDARGHTLSNYDVQTMMDAYATGNCEFDYLPADCERLLRWSDPDVNYISEAMGIEFTSTSQSPPSADMRDALEDKMDNVAAWVSYPYAAPDAPDDFEVNSQQCYGLSFVDWDTEATATHYQLFKSLSGSFTNPGLIYFGVYNQSSVNVPQYQTWYLKVRACNGSGCGDLTSVDTATYYPGCQ